MPVGLDDHARFASYFAGPNTSAVAYLSGMLEADDQVAWIWGPAGSGKTHLLQAACAQASDNGQRAMFVPLAAESTIQPRILDNCSDLALACVDDLHSVAGDREWEQALFRLFNDLTGRGGKLLVSATMGPQQVAFELPDLGSRLSWGPVFRLQGLNDAERIEALSLRAGHRGLELGEGVGEWLLRRVPRDMGALYRLLDTLDLESLAAGRRLTIPFVRGVLDQDSNLG